MISFHEGRQLLLIGGCGGDGTRLQDAFTLDLDTVGPSGSTGVALLEETEERDRAGVEEDDTAARVKESVI